MLKPDQPQLLQCGHKEENMLPSAIIVIIQSSCSLKTLINTAQPRTLRHGVMAT